jgi:hypothetical protein
LHDNVAATLPDNYKTMLCQYRTHLLS